MDLLQLNNKTSLHWKLYPTIQYPIGFIDKAIKPYCDNITCTIDFIAAILVIKSFYGSPLWQLEGVVSEDGSYRYGREPAMFPIARTETENIHFVLYPESIIVVYCKHTKQMFITRTDI